MSRFLDGRPVLALLTLPYGRGSVLGVGETGRGRDGGMSFRAFFVVSYPEYTII